MCIGKGVVIEKIERERPKASGYFGLVLSGWLAVGVLALWVVA